AILTTIGFPVLANFANDYGDGLKGTDNEERVGPQRAIQSGAITPKQMKNAMIVTGVITFIIALILIYRSFGKDDFINLTLFFLLGIASIVAAIRYTVGKNAYGYSGLGDVFVFLFFGLLSVVGSYYLYSKSLDNLSVFLPAIAIGLLCAAVLNLNNMRDQIPDKKAGKNTLVVKLGSQKAKLYHYTLLIIPMICMIVFTQQNYNQPWQWLFLIVLLPLVSNLINVGKNIIHKELDPELKKVALSTFFLSILFVIGLNL
ncbi:MAG: 1,4-dihydroxy-2-naphthoate octaprenyltransferase, partial [Flavobacteriaceae bacterium]|nr:1,4-dihydroxy-2-naphthoate octaprenyltransferase [Flavobacteriaceae bacterium]